MHHYLVKFRRTIRLRTPRNGEDQEDTTPRLFVHIPKTAGTSLRIAAETCFGPSGVLRDYGPESKETSQHIKDLVYAGGDPAAITTALVEHRAKLVSGHFPLTKYRDIFCLSDTATLLRNPVEQVVSHYQHMIKHYGHQGTLMDFARLPHYRNVQAQYIGMLDPALIGLVGLKESYRSFLKILNEQWGWNLPHRRRNVGNWLVRGRIRLTREERLEIKRLNALDDDLYRRASHVFANRLKAYESGIRSDMRGGITRAVAGHDLEGWALDMRSPAPVRVDIMVDGEHITRTSCDQPMFQHSGWKLPGAGLAGFTIGPVPLKAGCMVEIRDPAHGFILDRRRVRSDD